jgi:hypothetical protein
MSNYLARAGVLSALLLAASSYQANAVTFWIDSVVGAWTAVSPTGSATVSGGGTKISWGIPASWDGKSSYTFAGIAPPPKAKNIDTSFRLGTFTHNNFPIYGDSITDATLNVTITGRAVEGSETTDFSVSSIFEFKHNETPNVRSRCCNDIVTAETNEGASKSFSLAGHDYLFVFTGFQVDGEDFDIFSTKEGKKNKAYLLGSFEDVTGGGGQLPPVPLPAALPLFASILAGGGFVAWRRKRKAANGAA